MLILGAATLAAVGTSRGAETEPLPNRKERVQGIGGIFFRSRDPKALAEWYQQHLYGNPPGGTPRAKREFLVRVKGISR
jgi:hypothetical protein